MKRLITYSCMAIFAMGSMAQNQKDEAQMNRFISGLMKKMTLEEKVGQLSQCSGGFATGPDNTRISRTEDISKGLIGSLLNVSGAANTRKYQEAAMKSRLQIPLLFGLDVIHGYRTGFPLPLAEAASFDLDAIERGSRCAAKEAAAAGLHWTFAPMVDISWDARWGRVMEGAGEWWGRVVNQLAEVYPASTKEVEPWSRASTRVKPMLISKAPPESTASWPACLRCCWARTRRKSMPRVVWHFPRNFVPSLARGW